jgi:hypothetical protein
MFSLENFYYVLYTNLLLPAYLRESFFYPFGANDAGSIVKNYFTKMHQTSQYSKQLRPLVLFYDQEPINEQVIIDTNLMSAAELPSNIMTKKMKILANSERSPLVQKICREYKYADWYYFFHGFAALDWYRDYQYVPIIENHFSSVFISFNRLVTKDRSYRLTLVSKLQQQDLLKYGQVSLILKDNGTGTWQEELEDPDSRLSPAAKILVANTIPKFSGSLVIDTDNPPGHASADASAVELKLLRSGLWHVVTETVFYHDRLHLTEKIFKPIVARRPFILAGAQGNLAYLKSYGFKTFGAWIDESYDEILDPDLRLDAVTKELEKLCSLTMTQLKVMHEEMKEILEFNFQHFYGEFRKIITKELLDNFQECINSEVQTGVWDQGRISMINVDLSAINFAEVQNRLLR